MVGIRGYILLYVGSSSLAEHFVLPTVIVTYTSFLMEALMFYNFMTHKTPLETFNFDSFSLHLCF